MVSVTRAKEYTDLDLDFVNHPVTGDISKKVGVESIKRAVRNLVLTNFYERPFRSNIGSNARKLLFEPITPITATLLQSAILEVIKNFEPRVSVANADVRVSNDQNAYEVTLTFKINNRPEPIITSLFLSRVR